MKAKQSPRSLQIPKQRVRGVWCQASAAQVIGRHPWDQKVAFQFPVRAHARVAGSGHSLGAHSRQPIHGSLSHHVSLPLCLPP